MNSYRRLFSCCYVTYGGSIIALVILLQFPIRWNLNRSKKLKWGNKFLKSYCICTIAKKL